MRDIVMYKIDGNLVAYSAEEKEKINHIFSKSNKEVFLNLIGKLSEVQNNLKWATEPSILFETGMIKICLDTESPNRQATVIEDTSENTNDLASKVLTNLKENGKIRLHANLLSTKIEYGEDGIVHIIFNPPVDMVTKATFQKEETKIAIKEAVVKAMGRDVSVKYDNLK